MLYDFLLTHGKEILKMTEMKSLVLAGVRPGSVQLREGLPVFYKQLLGVLLANPTLRLLTADENAAVAKAAARSDESGMAEAAGRLEDVAVARSAGLHGVEYLRLGYTLSHVVHAYGAMCQSITEFATEKNVLITTREFRNLNMCLDVAIASAVTAYQSDRNIRENDREVKHLGFLAHELRNALGTVQMSLELIKDGTVGFGGSTGQVLDRGLKRMKELIDRSLTEVRLSVEPKVFIESIHIIEVVNQIFLTADIEAKARNQILEIDVDPDLFAEGDLQLIYSALSNIVQNALKYTHAGGKIQVRGRLLGSDVVIEVEDQCGGLSSEFTEDLFKPFEQQHENRKGLGLGLSIARRALELNHGKIEVFNLPDKGCVFTVTLPKRLNPHRTSTAPDLARL